MTEKELKKLRRADLLELLIASGKQLDSANSKLAEAEARLADRNIAIEESGSVAEASLRLNGVFEAAQQAAQQYLDVIEEKSRKTEEACRERDEKSKLIASKAIASAEKEAAALVENARAQAETMTAEAEKQAADMLADASRKAEAMTAEAKQQAETMIAEAEAKSKAYWDEVSTKLKEFTEVHSYLKSMLQFMSSGEAPR